MQMTRVSGEVTIIYKYKWHPKRGTSWFCLSIFLLFSVSSTFFSPSVSNSHLTSYCYACLAGTTISKM